MALNLEQCLVTGRGASAIYLLLQHLGKNGVLLAPANVCYAALYPALYAGWSLRFCDVDPITGHLTEPLVRQALEQGPADALLLPHMYGQPIAQLPQILALCKSQGVWTIEDCASAMGAQSQTYTVGQLGDYAVYSTGYAKTIEVGFGGLLAGKNDPLLWANELEQKLPLYSPQVQRTETLFSRLYRVLRNQGEGVLEQAVYAALPEGARSAFLFRLKEEEKQQVRQALNGLQTEVERRRNCLRDCQTAFEEQGLGRWLRLYPYTEGAVPWRLVLFTAPELHQPLIDACLEAGFPVSDWYPRVTPMFGDLGGYPGAKQMEQTILNFPLQQQTAQHICPMLARLLEKL